MKRVIDRNKSADPDHSVDPDHDTMRPEYDFSNAVRGATAARYAEGTNIVVIDPDVLDVFPDGSSVNDVLRALAPVLRQERKRYRQSPDDEPAHGPEAGT